MCLLLLIKLSKPTEIIMKAINKQGSNVVRARNGILIILHCFPSSHKSLILGKGFSVSGEVSLKFFKNKYFDYSNTLFN